MKQADLGLNLAAKRMRKREFLGQTQQVVLWVALVILITPYAPEGRRGRPPFALETMLRIHFMRQWFRLGDPSMEEALHDVPKFREFAGLNWDTAVLDETTILQFRRLLEEHKLAAQVLALVNELLSAKGLLLRAGTAVDGTLIIVRSSTKSKGEVRDPEMVRGDKSGPCTSKKGNQWHFGIKAHTGVNADSGLVHFARDIAGNVGDVVKARSLLHCQETQAWKGGRLPEADKRSDVKLGVCWHIAMHPGKHKLLDKNKLVDELAEQFERIKANTRAKVEHPFRVIKQQWGM